MSKPSREFLSASAVLRRGFDVRTKAVDGEGRTVEFIASTEAVDRMGDSIKLDGWRLDKFRDNPVILFGHNSGTLPIGKAVDVRVEDGALVVKVQFATAEEYPFANTVFKLVSGGYLSAVSVGFVPLRWEWVDDSDNGRFGWDILEAELLEVSVVPIPANPDALIQAQAKGINTGELGAWLRQTRDIKPTAAAKSEEPVEQSQDPQPAKAFDPDPPCPGISRAKAGAIVTHLRLKAGPCGQAVTTL